MPKKKGFSIGMSNYYRSRKTNSIVCRKIICLKEGKKYLKDKKKMERDIKRAIDIREDCKALTII